MSELVGLLGGKGRNWGFADDTDERKGGEGEICGEGEG